MTQATAQKWYDIKAAHQQGAGGEVASEAEIYIFGNIGDSWSEDGVVASSFVRDLSDVDATSIKLRINSYGGSVTDGLAIYNALRRHKANVQVHVEGVAISCASYIAMAGDTVTMAENAQMMIHAPWTVAGGNAVDLRAQADILDRYAQAMACAYAAKSGKPVAEALALITDGKDHWFSAAEAVAAGFADRIEAASDIAASLANSFNLTRFQNAKASAEGATQKEPTMATPEKQADTKPAFARTKEDNAQVLAMFKPFAARPEIAALQTEVLADPGMTIEQIQSRLLVEMGKGSEPVNPQAHAPRLSTVEDEADKRKTAVTAALMNRAGVLTDAQAKASIGANPYRGSKLLDLARASVERTGRKTEGMSQMEVVASAFTQSTSDFPVLLENVMHKTLLSAYATQPLTWNRFCATGSVSDFRAHNRYRLGSFGNLDTVTELGEFTHKAIPDGEKASISIGTKGNIINLSRQAIINDDLGAFVGLAAMLGRAAARSVESDVYALLALNSGLGPTMGDSKTLFHADHGNIGTGAAISVASIDADTVLMSQQKDISGNDYLALTPSVLLIASGLLSTARVINQAVYDPDTANKLQRPNAVVGTYSDIVGTPRLSGTRRYSFADPSVAPVIEVAFLDGASAPFIEMQRGFDVDGTQYKVRLDYGVGAIDYRGAVTNAGA